MEISSYVPTATKTLFKSISTAYLKYFATLLSSPDLQDQCNDCVRFIFFVKQFVTCHQQ